MFFLTQRKKFLYPFFILAIGILLFSFLLSGCKKKAPAQPVVGVNAPDFVLTDINGQPHSLSSMKGKVVVIDFWATWCPPCQASIPIMNKLYEKFKGANFEMLGISIDDGAGADGMVRSFVKNFQVAYPVARDDKGVADMYGVSGIPNLFIIGKDGVIRDHHMGYSPDELDEISGELQGLLK